MKKAFAAIALSCSLVASPVSAQTINTESLLAQIQALLQMVLQLQAQVQAAQGGVISSVPAPQVTTPSLTAPVSFFQPIDYDICITPPTRTLSLGVEGIDVLSLQEFLRDKAEYDGELGGYFGQLTEAAVKRYQRSVGIVSAGDAATTGYGVVGPKTRGFIAQFCAGTTANTGALQEGATSVPGAVYNNTTYTSPQRCAVAPTLPDNFCAAHTTATAVFGSDGCQTGWTCKTETTACTAVYEPVCGRAVTQCPAGAACSVPPPQTYSNTCTLNAANATLLYAGECTE